MNIRTSTKQQQYNIIPFPSFITNKTEQKTNGTQARENYILESCCPWTHPHSAIEKNIRTFVNFILVDLNNPKY